MESHETLILGMNTNYNLRALHHWFTLPF